MAVSRFSLMESNCMVEDHALPYFTKLPFPGLNILVHYQFSQFSSI